MYLDACTFSRHACHYFFNAKSHSHFFRVAVGIDHMSELVELAKQNVSKEDSDLLSSGQVQFITGDGRRGHEEMAPYDAIHVGAAASNLPQALIDQLKV